MKNQINVEGIRLYAYHGCLPEETKIGGEYIVDVYMTYDFSEAASTDDLNLTIDYCAVFEICKAEMAIPSKLIEHVGKRIYDKIIHTFPKLIETKVKVTKLLPPMNGPVDKVSIVIED
jgi:7,8-dihydroneopterin aldolase/epimerase/oxygenase